MALLGYESGLWPMKSMPEIPAFLSGDLRYHRDGLFEPWVGILPLVLKLKDITGSSRGNSADECKKNSGCLLIRIRVFLFPGFQPYPPIFFRPFAR